MGNSQKTVVLKVYHSFLEMRSKPLKTVLSGWHFLLPLLWVFAAYSAEIPGYAVASAHPLATQAGIEVLESGGNAFDAAVAISAALAVVEPTGSGIGGGGFWLLHLADENRDVFIDGRETAPRAASEDMYVVDGAADAKRSRDGALAAAIPGEPAALVHIAANYGSLPLSELLAPAIQFAREGFAVDAKLARAIAQHQTRFSGSAAEIFAPDDEPLAEGAVLVQDDLADTLQRLAAEGAAGFYAGQTAGLLLEGVRDANGIWDAEDLAGYKVVEREPLQFTFGTYRVVSAPPPSAGGIALAQSLQQLQALTPAPKSKTQTRHRVIESLRRAFRDRAEFLGDPDFVSVPVARLISRDYARQLARGISVKRATPSAKLPAPKPANEGGQTTHFSVIDRHGNRVAGTLSINLPFGSAFMAAGTGVLLNNEMDDFSAQVSASNAYGLIGSKANAIAPGKRPLSSMSPTFVEGPDGVLILGTPGGSRIISMMLLGALGYTEGLSAQQIVDLPRYHHQYLPDEVQFEPEALSADEQNRLKKMGHTLKALDARYGNMHVVTWDPKNQRLEAASDARGVGAARVVLKPD